ncbi:MAG: glutathione S-transferase N-terminal domain-containing protein [Burkholderiaceae bacterium]
MIELLQFRHSPYNEKARWALDSKRVPHTRRSLLPGPHMAIVRPLTGRTGTPVLRHDAGALDGSARIVEWLEARYPQPPLLPADAAQRAEALSIERRFDDDLTPRIRRPVLDALLRNPGYFARIFGDGRPRWQQMAYAAIVPLAAPLVRKGNGIGDAATLDDGHAAAREALDFVAERSRATGYLVGDAFTIADLTAAAALAMLARPANSAMAAPQPVGPAYAALMARYASHPAIAWTLAIYAKHRGATADFDGPSRS